ncbi:ImmA/IrrE family metallo-endopeptidase [Demequina oxidasica]|uniref:ImmA/IrrE family metallo-endopeptidase n=1 Tax=Demequina oxidasica TaxID=676199 RepID=UPI0007829434|nr:ImmA/IrrE family metallo-endopeptidase [Demequina oxidasica]
MARLIKEVAREAADLVLDDFWDGEFPVDPMRIAEALQIEVWTANLGPDVSGKIVKEANANARIYLNRDEIETRQNFTCAHELGHWWERRERGDTEFSFVEHRGQLRNAHEWYAEHFAANLLMPATEFTAECEDGARVRDLMRIFGVSRAAALQRCRSLGLEIG